MDAGMQNLSLHQTIGIDTIKKAVDLRGREVFSILQSAAKQQTQTPSQNTAQLIDLGQNIDIKG